MPQKDANKSREIARKKRGVIRAKSDFFRTARYGLTLQEHRIIYYAILKSQQEGAPFEPVTLAIRDFVDLCELKGQSYYSKIRALTKKVTGRVVEVIYKDATGEHLLQAAWLSSITYNTREGTVTIKPNKELQPFFDGKPFTETEYYFLIRFTSQYAERLYEVVKSLDHKLIIDFDVDDLRKRLAVPPTQYPNFKDLRRRVLEPAIRDINEYTDIDITMREKRGQYNRVNVVYFAISKKKVPKLADRVEHGEFTPPLSEADSQHLLLALLGDDAPEHEQEPQIPGQLTLDGGVVE